MKRIIVCYICKKPRRYDESYAVKVHDYTGEFEEETKAEGGGSLPPMRRRVGLVVYPKTARICRGDAKRLGYKVKALK